MQPMDGHFYTKDEETHWVISLLFFKFPYHFQFCFLVVVGIAVVNDVTVDIVVGVAVVVVFLWPWWPDQSFIVLFSSGFSRPPNTHIKQYFPYNATCGKSSESPFSILSVHFLLCVPSCGRCLWHSDSLLWSDCARTMLEKRLRNGFRSSHARWCIASCFILFLSLYDYKINYFSTYPASVLR